MIEQLFGSKTRVKLLRLFYSNPNRAFYVREITRKIDEQINSVRRELSNLLSIGLISSDTNNNRLYYEVNQKYEFYKPLSTIFGGAVLTEKVDAKSTDNSKTSPLKQLGNIELAIFTGKFTRDDRSGVDIMVVGDVNKTKFDKFISDLEAEEGHELRYTLMPVNEFTYRRQINDRFITSILSSKKQVLIDKNNVLETDLA
jgi:predicted transcriptional regulator